MHLLVLNLLLVVVAGLGLSELDTGFQIIRDGEVPVLLGSSVLMDVSHKTLVNLCREFLGRSYESSALGAPDHGLARSQIDCKGYETAIRDCIMSTKPVAGNGLELTCGPPKSISVMLVRPNAGRFVPTNANTGLLVTFSGGFAGTVCGENMDDQIGERVCHMLGFPGLNRLRDMSQTWTSNFDTLNGRSIWVNRFACDSNCSYVLEPHPQCTHAHDVVLECRGERSSRNWGSLRLSFDVEFSSIPLVTERTAILAEIYSAIYDELEVAELVSHIAAITDCAVTKGIFRPSLTFECVYSATEIRLAELEEYFTNELAVEAQSSSVLIGQMFNRIAVATRAEPLRIASPVLERIELDDIGPDNEKDQWGLAILVLVAFGVGVCICLCFTIWCCRRCYCPKSNRTARVHTVVASQVYVGGLGPPVIPPGRSAPLTKIQAASETMITFLEGLMSVRDRCSVVAFNNQYMPLINLGTEDNAKIALQAVKSKCQGSTNLWDAVIVSVVQFISTADKSRPWILIVLTDGDDTGSSQSITDCAKVLTTFNAVSNNFTFVIGLGRAVNASKLQQLCNNSGSLYLAAKDSLALDFLFALIAVQVVEGVRLDLAAIEMQGVEAVFARVEQTRELQRNSIDILLLVDISGSMNEQ